MKSIRDIYKIGKGPSSSHTIGPERAATHFKSTHPEADAFQVDLFGSLSKTGKGHGTDRVLREVLSPLPTEIVFRTDTPADVTHPNTMDFSAIKDGKVYDTLRVESIGGGDIHYAGHAAAKLAEVYPENSFAEVEQFCRFRGLDLAEYVEINEDEGIWDFLAGIWEVMKTSVREGLAAAGNDGVGANDQLVGANHDRNVLQNMTEGGRAALDYRQVLGLLVAFCNQLRAVGLDLGRALIEMMDEAVNTRALFNDKFQLTHEICSFVYGWLGALRLAFSLSYS